MLTKEVGLGFFAEGGFENTGAGTANRFGIGHGIVAGVAGGVLLDRKKAGYTFAINVGAAHQMAGAFGRNHKHINIGRRHNLAEMNVKAVGKQEGITRLEVGCNFCFVD